MQWLHTILRKFLAAVCVLLSTALTLTVTWQVVSRYVFKAPSGFSEELAKIIFVWLVLMASAYLFGETDGHMNMSFLVDKTKGKTRVFLALLSQLTILAFDVFVLVLGGQKAVLNGLRQMNPAIPQISTGQIYAALFICGIFTAFFCIHFIVDDIRQLVSKESSI